MMRLSCTFEISLLRQLPGLVLDLGRLYTVTSAARVTPAGCTAVFVRDRYSTFTETANTVPDSTVTLCDGRASSQTQERRPHDARSSEDLVASGPPSATHALVSPPSAIHRFDFSLFHERTMLNSSSFFLPVTAMRVHRACKFCASPVHFPEDRPAVMLPPGFPSASSRTSYGGRLGRSHASFVSSAQRLEARTSLLRGFARDMRQIRRSHTNPGLGVNSN